MIFCRRPHENTKRLVTKRSLGTRGRELMGYLIKEQVQGGTP
jgi:hypothetical protein